MAPMYKSHVGYKISQCGLGAHCVSNIKEVDLCVLKTKSLELEHSRILTSLYHGQRANVVKVPCGRLEGMYDLAHGSGTFHPVQGFPLTFEIFWNSSLRNCCKIISVFQDNANEAEDYNFELSFELVGLHKEGIKRSQMPPACCAGPALVAMYQTWAFSVGRLLVPKCMWKWHSFETHPLLYPC